MKRSIIFISVMSISILGLLFVGSCTSEEANTDPLSAVSNNRSAAIPPNDEKSLLDGLKSIWTLYDADSEEGANFRRKMSGKFRTMVFNRSLMAYWDVRDAYPESETPEQTIKILEDEHLIPFWPLDPESGELIKILSDPNNVFEYKDLHMDLADNGSFDYKLILYDGSTYAPYIGEKMESSRMGEISHTYSAAEAAPLSDEAIEEIELPTDPGEVFAGMIEILFMQMIHEAFIANDFQVPVDLPGLLAGRLTINKKGWGHPAGSFGPDEVGNFEFGVDPDLNAFYLDTTGERLGRTVWAVQFQKKEIAGEMIYDMRTPLNMFNGINNGEMKNKIPLLTDELFAGPPPEL